MSGVWGIIYMYLYLYSVKSGKHKHMKKEMVQVSTRVGSIVFWLFALNTSVLWFLLPNALFKSILHIFDCYTIIFQLLGERGTVKTIDRSIVNYWLVTWQMTSRNVKSPDVNDEYRHIVDNVSAI